MDTAELLLLYEPAIPKAVETGETLPAGKIYRIGDKYAIRTARCGLKRAVLGIINRKPYSRFTAGPLGLGEYCVIQPRRSIAAKAVES